MSCDLLIKGGTVVDGTGATPAFVRSRQPRHSSINALPTARLNLLPAAVQVGDVAVADGKIVAVGPDLGMEAAKVIDASGKHVMPGWTDIHTCAPALEPNIGRQLEPTHACGAGTTTRSACGTRSSCRPARAASRR